MRSPKTKKEELDYSRSQFGLDYALYMVENAFRALPENAVITGIKVDYYYRPTKKSAGKVGKRV